MTGIDEKALNEKLAKWAGFTRSLSRYHFEGGAKTMNWQPPVEGWVKELADKHLFIPDTTMDYLPDFTHSLDACFKWLVPLALERLRIIYSCSLTEAEKRLFGRWLGERDDNPQLDWTTALCLAIEKLILPSG